MRNDSSSSIDDPGQNISKATMRGVWIAAAVYIFSTAAIMGMIPANQLQTSITPFADAAEKFMVMEQSTGLVQALLLLHLAH